MKYAQLVTPTQSNLQDTGLVGALRQVCERDDCAQICYAAADEIAKLQAQIVSALDCLHHDDVEMARSILSK